MQWPLDIERLHRCVEAVRAGRPLERGEGATTARAVLLAGDFEFGPPNGLYMFVVENRDAIRRTQHLVAELLQQADCPITRVTADRITANGNACVWFIAADQFFSGDSWRGVRPLRVYFDVSRHAVARRVDARDTLAYTKCIGADIV